MRRRADDSCRPRRAQGAATITALAISVAQSPVVLKMQGGLGAKGIFNEMAEQYGERVNEMAGGRLRIDI